MYSSKEINALVTKINEFVLRLGTSFKILALSALTKYGAALGECVLSDLFAYI